MTEQGKTTAGYVVNRSVGEGLEKVSKLFANTDGSFGNKKDGYTLNLGGKFPEFLKDGKKYGACFENQSKKSGETYYRVKHDDGDFLIFKEKPFRPKANSYGRN